MLKRERWKEKDEGRVTGIVISIDDEKNWMERK
jgi:hypothetical protein